MKSLRMFSMTVVFLLSYTQECNSQQLILGGGFIKTLASKNYHATDGGGINIFGEYSTGKVYSFRLHINQLLNNDPKQNILFNDLITSVNFSILFSPPYKICQVFAGGGIGYYVHNPGQEGHGNLLTGNHTSGNEISNNFGLNFTGGIRFPTTGFMTLVIQLRYTLHYSKVTATFDDFVTGKLYKVKTGSLNLGGLYLDLDLAFRLWRY